jgi:hypothetical protein
MNAPPPSPPPLRTITTVHASPFCGTLQHSIAPALSALTSNDAAIAQGKQVLLKMAQSNPGFYAVKLGEAASVVARNLDAIHAALKTLDYLPNLLQTDDERRLRQWRDLLTAMAGRQERMLDVLGGTSASYTSNELLERRNPIPMSAEDLYAMAHPAPVAGPPFTDAYNALTFYERQEASLKPIAAQAIFESNARCR